MTHALTLSPRRDHATRMEATLRGLIARHGRWRVIRASLFAKPIGQDRVEDLPDSIRKDIGLTSHDATLPSQRQHVWE
ncbi:hypothetical protein [Aliiroseovarius marinus]|uniref:hypothetical protein n=1 Tax=Aliiroseovarius marinus TaxID=2500159 RepID=UPI003D7D5E1E